MLRILGDNPLPNRHFVGIFNQKSISKSSYSIDFSSFQLDPAVEILPGSSNLYALLP
jgi:hypothetical protein